MKQHDDHVWVTMNGRSWAICEIPRRPDGGFDIIHCWRGYWPFLQYTTIDVTEITSWEPYCEAAAQLLEGAEYATTASED